VNKTLSNYRVPTFVDHNFIYNTVFTHARMLAMGIITANEYEKMCAALGIKIEFVKIE